MPCVIKREILDNFSKAQSAAVIDNETKRTETEENKCYVESLRSEYGHITRPLFQSSQPLLLLSVLVRRGRCGQKKSNKQNDKKMKVNKVTLIQMTGTELEYAYFCN
jgi:hypothetical protein